MRQACFEKSFLHVALFKKVKMLAYIFTFLAFLSLILLSSSEKISTRDTLPCSDNHICQTQMPGSKCVENFCLCVNEAGCDVVESRPKTTKLGNSCFLSIDCLIDDSECSNDVCTCNLGFEPSKDGRKCLRVSEKRTKATCDFNSECIEPFSLCINNTCQEAKDVDFRNVTNSKKLGEPCKNSEDCPIRNSHCDEEICKCKVEFITYNDSECLSPVTTVAEQCNEDIQCITTLGMGSACTEGVCACKEFYNYYKEINKCTKTTRVSTRDTLPCTDDEMCSRDMPGSKCFQEICVCFSEKGCDVVEGKAKSTKLGKPCVFNSDCLIDASECSNETCTCKRGFIPSDDGRKCLMEPQHSPKCKHSSDCAYPLSVCRDNRCQCPDGMDFKNETCQNIRKLGELCSEDQNCIDKDSECKQNICKCKGGFLMNFAARECVTREYFLLKTGPKCSEDSECTTVLGMGSICIRGRCACKNSYIYFKDIQKCIKNSTLRITCTTKADCFSNAEEDEKYVCSDGYCICNTTFFEENGKCVSDSAPITATTLASIVLFFVSFILIQLF